MINAYRKRSLKGTTLTELSVVLALISIVSLLVVSFSVMVHTRSMAATTKNRVADDLRLSKVVIENWIDQVTNVYDAEVTVSLDGKSLIATVDGILYSAELNEDEFNATLPDDKTINCPIDEIKEFQFEELKKTDDGQLEDAIWFCTAKYVIPKMDGAPIQQQSTFCVNSHIGDALS